MINIFDTDKDGIWVPSFDKNSCTKFPDEVNTLIKNVLHDVLGAKETDDPCVFTMSDETSDDKDKKDESEDKEKDEKSEEENNSENTNNSDENTSDNNDSDDLL